MHILSQIRVVVLAFLPYYFSPQGVWQQQIYGQKFSFQQGGTPHQQLALALHRFQGVLPITSNVTTQSLAPTSNNTETISSIQFSPATAKCTSRRPPMASPLTSAFPWANHLHVNAPLTRTARPQRGSITKRYLPPGTGLYQRTSYLPIPSFSFFR